MASSQSSILFDDLFTVKDVNPGGRKFDRVSRIVAKSSNHDMDLTLDINDELYPLQTNEIFSLVLASSLSPEGGAGEAEVSWRQQGSKGLADEYDYVMYGKVYKFDEGTADRVTAYASFGGLLMALAGSYRHVSRLTVRDYVYLLIRK